MSTEKSKAKLAYMVQPGELKTEKYQIWSEGRGVDVWEMLCASIAGDLETVKKLLSRDPKLLTCTYEYLSPLHFAVRENHQQLVHYLLEKGADPRYQHYNGLLEMARDRGYAELIHFFESKLNERYQVAKDGAVIAKLFKAFDVAGIRDLLQKSPELVHAADENGNQAIHWATMTRQLELIDYALALGADIDAERPDGARPLDLTNGDYDYRGWRDLPMTALRTHTVVIGYLLARGAYLDISVAAKIGHLDRVRELLDKDPTLINKIPPYDGYYSGLPLRCAAAAGHMEVVKLLLERGANVNEPEPGIAPQGGALHAAIGGGHTAIVKLLLEHGANPNAAVESSGNCLSMARWVHSKEIEELVLAYGAKLGINLASYEGDEKALAEMLDEDPELNVADTINNMINNGHQHLLELVLRHKPDLLKKPLPNPWWGSGIPPTPELARWLFEKGYDPNGRNWLGMVLLHRCASKGNIAIASVALDFGADINIIDTENSSTPLGWAAKEGKKEMVEWLLKKGADPNLPKDEPWAQPVAWATRKGHVEIVEMLNAKT